MTLIIPESGMEFAIYCTTTNRIIDMVPKSADPTTHLQSLVPTYGSQLITLPFEDAWHRFEDSIKSPPAEISAERFDEMLSILPPVGWTTDSDGECFRMCERLAGTITAIFVRIGDRYVSFHDDIRTPHRECCRRAAEYLSQHPVPSSQ